MPSCEHAITFFFYCMMIGVACVVTNHFFWCMQVSAHIHQEEYDKAADILAKWECPYQQETYLAAAPNQDRFSELKDQKLTIDYLVARSPHPWTTYTALAQGNYDKNLVADAVTCTPENLIHCLELETVLPQLRPKITPHLPLENVFDFYDDHTAQDCMHRCLDFGLSYCLTQFIPHPDPHKYTYLARAAIARQHEVATVHAIVNDGRYEVDDDNVDFLRTLVRYDSGLAEAVDEYDDDEARMEYILEDDDDEDL